MSRKFSVSIGADQMFSAGSFAALLRIIEAEEQRWRAVLLSMTIEGPNSVHTFRAQYPALCSHITAVWADTNSNLQLLNRPDLKIFPRFDSTAGKALQTVLDQPGIASSFMLAFAVEAKWEGQERLNLGGRQGSDIAVGRALLAMSKIEKSPLKEVSAAVADGVAKAESDLQVLQSKLDAFENLVGTSSDTVSTSVAVVAERTRALLRIGDRLVRRYAARSEKREKQWQKDFADTHASYVAKLQFEAPAVLWTTSAEVHRKRSDKAFNLFLWLMAGIILVVLLGATFLGPSVAEVFSHGQCPEGSTDCVARFSPEGPLLVGAILLSLSMAIWVLRMANRIHLSERNLAQAAEEKKAFVETYLALIKDGNVTRDQEAIVLGAIFRPSSDGYVSDDGSSIDISAAAVLAKVMSGRN